MHFIPFKVIFLIIGLLAIVLLAYFLQEYILGISFVYGKYGQLDTFYDLPSAHWNTVEADFANLNLNYNIYVPTISNYCDNAELFVFVPTSPSSFERRQVIRDTWASSENTEEKVVVKFVIGKPEDPNMSTDLLEEQKKHDDLILYDHPDEIQEMHIKMHAAFKWQQIVCPDVKFIFRADDDTVVDLPRLQFWIDKEMSDVHKKNPAILFGAMRRNDGAVIRDPKRKRYVSETDYPDDVFPPYCFGALYILSNEAVTGILEHTHEVNAFSLDDVLYTGILAEKAGVLKIDASKHFIRDFNYENKPECEEIDGLKMPLSTALCCFEKLSDMEEAYKVLRNIKCEKHGRKHHKKHRDKIAESFNKL
ncbi:galactosyltransferase domain-containing protein [Ditylenchus destructor]|nr:galactosyltransferase domain-containing protein [Ditylenchus destructor]